MNNNKKYGFTVVDPKENKLHLNLSDIYRTTFQLVTIKINQSKTELIPSSFHFIPSNKNIIKFKELSFNKQTSFIDNEEIQLMLLFPNHIETKYCLLVQLYIDNVGVFDGFTIFVDIKDDYNEDDLRTKDRNYFIQTNLYNNIFLAKPMQLLPQKNIKLTFEKDNSQREKLKKDISKIKIENEILRNENTMLINKETLKKMLSFQIDKLQSNFVIYAKKKKYNNILHIVTKEITSGTSQTNSDNLQTNDSSSGKKLTNHYKTDNIIDEFFNTAIKIGDKANITKVIDNTKNHHQNGYNAIKLTNSYLMNEISPKAKVFNVQDNCVRVNEANDTSLSNNIVQDNNSNNISVKIFTSLIISSYNFVIINNKGKVIKNRNNNRLQIKLASAFTINNHLNKEINNNDNYTTSYIAPKNENENELTEEEIEKIMNNLDKKYYILSIFDKNEIKKSIIEGKGDKNKIQKILFV